MITFGSGDHTRGPAPFLGQGAPGQMSIFETPPRELITEQLNVQRAGNAQEASTGLALTVTPAPIICRMVPHYHAILHDHLWRPGGHISAPVLGSCKDDHGGRMINFRQHDHLRAPAPSPYGRSPSLVSFFPCPTQLQRI